MRVSCVVAGLTVGAVLLAVHPGASVAPEQAPAAASTVEAQRAFVAELLRRLPQRPREERRLLVERARRRPPRREREARRGRHPQGAGRTDAAGRRAPPPAGVARGVQRLAGFPARRDGGVAPRVQGARAPPAEPARVSQRGPRRARHRRRRLRAPATRRPHRFVRQHVGCADDQPGVDAGLHPGRRQGGAPGARRSEGRPGDGEVRRAEGRQPDAPHRGHAVRDARRHRAGAPVPRRRHLHLPERALLLLPGRAHRRQPARVAAGPGTRDLDRRPAGPRLHHRPPATKATPVRWSRRRLPSRPDRTASPPRS